MTQFTARFFSQQRVWQCIVIFMAATFLYGCGGRPVVAIYKPEPKARYPEPVVPQIAVPTPPPVKDRYSGPAAPLYQKAEKFISAREYRQAELAMERALRIEPKNGYYWYTLAEIKFAEKEYGKTVQLCLKSKSLAGTDTRLIELNDRLMAKSR